MSSEFKNYLIRRGFSTADTESGADCVLVYDSRGNHFKRTTVTAMSAAELYAKKNELGIELNKIYESVSGYNWAAKLNTTGSGVDVFKVNSYRVDFNGPRGLQFVETAYGNDQLQIFLPYNYTKDVVDNTFPAFILNKNLRRIVVAYPYAVGSAVRNCSVYFDQTLYDEEENAKDITTIHLINEDLMIIDDRYISDRSRWGSFEHPTKALKMLIRLLLRAGWINPDYMLDLYDGIYSMKSLGIEESSQNPYGFEVIDGEIRRFTKYSDDLWIEIPLYYGGFQFIKPKEQFVYEKPNRPFRRPRDENKIKLTADVIIRTNFSDKGVSFIGFNLEENYIFTTIEYNIFDMINGNLPQYEIEDVWPNYNKEAEVVEDEDDEDDDIEDDEEDVENISSIVEADTECDKALIEAE